MYFKSSAHEILYREFCSIVQCPDPETRSALYVLGSLEKDCIKDYLDRGRIQFENILTAAKSWSSGEKALVRLAAVLFNSFSWSAKIEQIFPALDADNFRVAIEALIFRYEQPLTVIPATLKSFSRPNYD